MSSSGCVPVRQLAVDGPTDDEAAFGVPGKFLSSDFIGYGCLDVFGHGHVMGGGSKKPSLAHDESVCGVDDACCTRLGGIWSVIYIILGSCLSLLALVPWCFHLSSFLFLPHLNGAWRGTV